MALKTGKEYMDSIKSLVLEAHVMGEKTGDLPDHPMIDTSITAVATTFDWLTRMMTRPKAYFVPGQTFPVNRSIASPICTRALKTL